MELKRIIPSGDLSGVKFYQYFRQPSTYKAFDVIIIGGSYAGLSAAMTLGRSLRRVLVIDSGSPCNAKTLQVHNFITMDNEDPSGISKKSKQQVLKYKTVRFIHDKVTTIKNRHTKFEINTSLGEKYAAKKILLATGIFDRVLSIPGFSDCWGVSIVQCPYCHGYEFYNTHMGILANADTAFELAKLLTNWTKKITIFPNGESKLSAEQVSKISKRHISIVEKKITRFTHSKGQVNAIIFEDQTSFQLNVIFTRLTFMQPANISGQELGCALTEEGLIKVDEFQRTSVQGIYAAGDNCISLRSCLKTIQHNSYSR